MDEEDFEGSHILERLASLNLVDEFFQAIDSDNFEEVENMLEHAGIDEDTIASVLKQMTEV
jgi:hypothetical protein